MFKNALRQLRHGFNRPFMVMFETTLHCNMKCGYCAIWQNQQPEDRAVRERVFKRMETKRLTSARLHGACRAASL
jgi:MoaA/NifB/PqqE/SkfB family radical SAM enzyme